MSVELRNWRKWLDIVAIILSDMLFGVIAFE